MFINIVIIWAALKNPLHVNVAIVNVVIFSCRGEAIIIMELFRKLYSMYIIFMSRCPSFYDGVKMTACLVLSVLSVLSVSELSSRQGGQDHFVSHPPTQPFSRTIKIENVLNRI